VAQVHTTSATACTGRRFRAVASRTSPTRWRRCPFQAGAAGFTSFAEPIAEDKVRGKPQKFAEH